MGLLDFIGRRKKQKAQQNEEKEKEEVIGKIEGVVEEIGKINDLDPYFINFNKTRLKKLSFEILNKIYSNVQDKLDSYEKENKRTDFIDGIKNRSEGEGDNTTNSSNSKGDLNEVQTNGNDR